MHQDSIASKIMERIEKASSDSVYTASDFSDLGEYNSVRQALLRLEKSGKIKKIARGVYYCPYYSELIQEYASPSPNRVAEAIARKFNWTITADENVALNLLGLSTQVPARWSYISDGPYYKVKIGNQLIEFKHRNNREISGMSPITALVVQALKAIGKGNVNDKQIKIIRRTLGKDGCELLLKETRQSSAWIRDVVKKICIKNEEEYNV